jgi:hypothetical protein
MSGTRVSAGGVDFIFSGGTGIAMTVLGIEVVSSGGTASGVGLCGLHHHREISCSASNVTWPKSLQ